MAATKQKDIIFKEMKIKESQPCVNQKGIKKEGG